MTGEEFKTIRKNAGLTQKEMAEFLGFAGPQTVKNMEGGNVKTAPLVIKVLRYLDSLPSKKAADFIEVLNQQSKD